MYQRKMLGVTLIELLLVSAVVGMIMVMVVGFIQQKNDELRRERVSIQMQSILNAALSSYIANGQWPAVNWGDSFHTDYLRPTTPWPWLNPWAQQFNITNDTKYFYVCTDVQTQANASMVAGTLPGGYVSPSGCPTGPAPQAPVPGVCTSAAPTPSPSPTSGQGPAPAPATSSCYAVGAVNIPGQNLNNATAVNFAGVYKPGACVPAPECPVDSNGNTMTPQIFVVPTSVGGENESGNYYPINGFTAYAAGQVSNQATPVAPNEVSSCLDISPQVARVCKGPDSLGNPTLNANLKYWRVCLQISTEKGIVQTSTNSTWGNDVSVIAFTRCQSSKEYTGASFSVYDQ